MVALVGMKRRRRCERTHNMTVLRRYCFPYHREVAVVCLALERLYLEPVVEVQCGEQWLVLVVDKCPEQEADGHRQCRQRAQRWP